MSGILNDLSNLGNQVGTSLAGGASSIDKLLSSNSQNTNNDFSNQGFIVPPVPSVSQQGLPSAQVPYGRLGRAKRDIIKIFVPDVGLVSLYVNPQSINYAQKKLIQQDRTKGGYILQYWGEELQTLHIVGNTGSSGIEGLQVLEQVYRAEQILFDPLALTMAADNSINGMNSLIDSFLGNLGGFSGSLANSTLGLLNLDPASQNILPRQIPSLASLAFGIEIYYSGIVMRGYFSSFSYEESVSHLGLFDYNIDFVVTQKKGYRLNSLPWQKSAISGPSGDGVPLSFSGLSGQNPNTVSLTNGTPFASP